MGQREQLLVLQHHQRDCRHTNMPQRSTTAAVRTSTNCTRTAQSAAGQMFNICLTTKNRPWACWLPGCHEVPLQAVLQPDWHTTAGGCAAVYSALPLASLPRQGASHFAPGAPGCPIPFIICFMA